MKRTTAQGKAAGAWSPKYPLHRAVPITLLRAREAYMEHSRSIFAKMGITEQQWRVMRVLYSRGRVESWQLAQDAYLLKPSLSRILRDLSAEKYLKKEVDRADSRRVWVSLTSRGVALCNKVGPMLELNQQQVLADFPSADLQTLLDLLDKFAAAARGNGR